MSLVKNKNHAYLVLVIFSILSMIIWRIEVEYHGWKGLIWLTYTHFSIPICLGLFIVWVNLFFKLGNFRNRIKINIFLILWISLGTFALITSLKTTFISGPSAMVHFLYSDEKILMLTLIKWFALFFPIISLTSLRLLNIKIPPTYIFASFLLFLLSFPLAILVIEIINDKGSPNFIHAVKSGFVFPFLFFSLGLPLIYSSVVEKIEKDENPFILDDID